MVGVGRVIVIDAEINEFVLHLVDNLPTVSLVLFLEVLRISFYIISEKRAKEVLLAA